MTSQVNQLGFSVNNTTIEKRTNLWYCSLEHKFCHVSLGGVGGMDGDNCNIGIGVGPLKCELDFQAIFVVRRHWRNACKTETVIVITPSYFALSAMMKSNASSPAAMSLKRGCEVRPSKRKGGWDMGTEGAGVGVGPPEGWEGTTEWAGFHPKMKITKDKIRITKQQHFHFWVKYCLHALIGINPIGFKILKALQYASHICFHLHYMHSKQNSTFGWHKTYVNKYIIACTEGIFESERK